MYRSIWRAVLFLALGTNFCFAQSASNPFAGKQINLTINFSAGGPTDLEGRLFGRYLSKHLEGNPPIIAMNREGAGGITGAVALGEQGARDGTAVGYLTGVAWNFAMFPEKFPISMRQFEFVGFQSGTSVSYVRTAALKNFQQPSDILRGQTIISGGLSAGEVKDVLMRLTLDILGVRYKHVTGYQSSSAARLALQRGEIDFHSESLPGFLGVVSPQLVSKGLVTPLFHDSMYDGKTVRSADIPQLGAPAFHEFATKATGSKPSGPLWDAYLGVLAANQAAQRLIVLPPKSSQTALSYLRDAVSKINSDQEFAEAATKVLGFAPQYETGADTNLRMTAIFDSVTHETLRFVREYMSKSN
jgi:tripartite-type tricarboxylate transporter receptor subunit TctC